MQINAEIIFEYETESQARMVLRSLKPDNIDFRKSYTENNLLICKLSGDSLRTILATMDDLLFCEMMTEKITDLIEGDIR
jgi:Transcription factor Pcc1